MSLAMKSTQHQRVTTKFYQEDIVQRISDPTSYGIVLRCWHDSDDIPAIDTPLDPLLRPLKRGEVGVSFFPAMTRDILPESEFTLVDRPLQPGDVCKRRIEDLQSAVVMNANVKFKVQHAISRQKLDDWKTLADVKCFEDVTVGCYVAYNDWIGQIQEMFDESTIEIGNGSLVRLPEISARLSVGDRGSEILPNPPDEGSGVASFFTDDVRPSPNDTVLAIKHTVYAISWLAVNQLLNAEEASKRQRPRQFWSGSDISKLILVRGASDYLVRVGDKLSLHNPPEDVLTKHGRTGEKTGTIVVNTFVVWETETIVSLLWQDGSKEIVRSTELIPYLNPDEYDCWPGDHVMWKAEEEAYGAVVQSVNATERTADIKLYDGRRELVSVLELDPHGSDANMGGPQNGFGVHRGDLVFIHREGSTNGCEKPTVPSIGELESWVNEVPVIGENGEFTGWRKVMDKLGQKIARTRGVEPVIDGYLQGPDVVTGKIDWFGEVSDLKLDGSVEVTLPHFHKVIVPLEQLTRLIDSLEQLQDLWGDQFSDAYSDYYDDDEVSEDLFVEVLSEDGRWHAYKSSDDDEWVEDDSEEFNEDSMETEDDAAAELSKPNVQTDELLEDIQPDCTDVDNAIPSTSSTPVAGPSVTEKVDNLVSAQAGKSGETSWKRFDILPSAPADHAFHSTTPAQPSRQFLSRLSKEYRALSSSLPESIVVRTYEDRTDLLRSLIIGPENTPYEDAPFVIDWMLDSNFPQTPPVAHFLSWTNGNGRVNPNLYEEGKVCLSILGTWAGDRNESWSPTRSSLLQALVSIQGLVLVKEPWFCEPAYEKWRDTDEGKVNSRLYSEKAYVLSRGFVRRALEIPLGGLDNVIRDIYFDQGKLAKVIGSAHALMEKSKTTPEGHEEDSDLAVPRLTGGGVITLSRILDKLETLQTSLCSRASSSSTS